MQPHEKYGFFEGYLYYAEGTMHKDLVWDDFMVLGLDYQCIAEFLYNHFF